MTFGCESEGQNKFNATVKLLNIDLIYLAASTKSLYRTVFEISVLLCIKNLKFKIF